MAKVKTRIDRTAVNLPTLPLFDLSDFNQSVAIPIQQQIDDKPWELVSTVTFTPVTSPPPGNIPPGTEPPGGEVLYDSTLHSTLHNGVARTITGTEGSTSAGGKGVKMAGTGSPKIVVNADKTFSLWCGSGYGRFYCYIKNYDATMDIECAFMNSVGGQECIAQLRSRYLESGDCTNRFAGYVVSVMRDGYKAERLECSGGTSLTLKAKTAFPSGTAVPATGKYFTLQFTVKKEGDDVRLIGTVSGKQVLNQLDSSPKPGMVNQSLYDSQSYFGIQQHVTSGTGELRIKRLRLIQA